MIKLAYAVFVMHLGGTGEHYYPTHEYHQYIENCLSSARDHNQVGMESTANAGNSIYFCKRLDEPIITKDNKERGPH